MFYLGLLTAVCYIPGYIGASIPAQLAFLSIVLPLGLWRHTPLSLGHLAGLLTLGWSAISLLWTPNIWDGLHGLWLFAIWALTFYLGSTITDLRPIWRGLAAGLTVSSLVAIVQALGYRPVESTGDTGFPGLLFNQTVLGASCALTIIALWTQRQWLWIPGLLPGLYLANSRGAYLTLAIVAVARYLHWTVAAGVLSLGGLFFLTHLSGSDSIRLTIWGAAGRVLTLLGYGIGSFSTFLMLTPTQLYHPDRVHNDYLQLLFELGLGAIPIFYIYLANLRDRRSDHWPVFLAFAILGLFYFPLWAPVPAFIGCLCAGTMFADRHQSWLLSSPGRYSSLPSGPLRRPLFARLGRQALPPVPPA